MIETNATLLERMRAEGADDAWEEFYHIYWRPIVSYARRLGLDAESAQDVLQETMITFIRILPEFKYDRERGRFRNFLLTITHRKALARMRRARREGEVEWCDDDSLANLAGAAEFVSEEEMELRWREALMENALRRLREDAGVDQRTLDIFFAYAIEHQSASAVASIFGVKENAVYQIKNRLMRRLQADVARLLRDSKM